MKVNLDKTVYQAALDRIDWLYDEFPHVIVSYSGGKDSTVICELAVEVAERKGKLPVDVLFIDQEAEWTSTVEIMRTIDARPEINLHWLQVPIQIFNATSAADPWLWCWREGDEWLRPKEPGSIHDNEFGTTRLVPMFDAYATHLWGDEPVAQLNGVRCEESPARTQGLTVWPCYKHITWGNKKEATARHPHFVFSPIYDWRYIDVWKAIHDNGWPYNALYDLQYQHGIPTRNMRVSNLHHETAVRSLEYAHEVDGELWDRLSARLQGVNSAKHMEQAFRQPPVELPRMFSDWREYRDYLLENLITDEEIKATFKRQFGFADNRYMPLIHEKLWRMHVGCLLANDYHGTKMSTFEAANMQYLVGAGKRETEWSRAT